MSLHHPHPGSKGFTHAPPFESLTRQTDEGLSLVWTALADLRYPMPVAGLPGVVPAPPEEELEEDGGSMESPFGKRVAGIRHGHHIAIWRWAKMFSN